MTFCGWDCVNPELHTHRRTACVEALTVDVPAAALAGLPRNYEPAVSKSRDGLFSNIAGSSCIDFRLSSHGHTARIKALRVDSCAAAVVYEPRHHESAVGQGSDRGSLLIASCGGI